MASKISINNHQVDRWKADVAASVEFYNEWFLRFAPQTYIAERNEAAAKVEQALKATKDLSAITPQKMNQLRDTYGNNLRYILFLCGYFDTPFQGYVASEGIDWVWEHRINDFDVLFK